jgi:hypothetical protein
MNRQKHRRPGGLPTPRQKYSGGGVCERPPARRGFLSPRSENAPVWPGCRRASRPRREAAQRRNEVPDEQ